MHLLIDTAFDCCQVGLWHGDQLYDSLSVTGEAHHDVILAPLVAQLLQQTNQTVRMLDGVAAMTGPGRFTSLRVGIAFARALVLPNHLPLVGITTGDIIRSTTQTPQPAWLVMVKRGEVFAQTPDMPQPIMVTLPDLAQWLQTHQIDAITVIGAGVPTGWQDIVPADVPCTILDRLPLNIMGQQAAAQFAIPSTEPLPVRPFYGASTGAWAT